SAVEELRLVARAGVGEDRHHGVPRAEVLSQADRAGDVDAARAPQAQAFLLQQIKNQRQSLGVRDLVGVIDRRALDIFRDASLADAFGDRRALRLQLAVLEPVVQRRAHRVRQGDADVFVLFLEKLTYTGECPTGADGTGEAVHPAAGLLPDFRACAAVVSVAVSRVVPLVGPERAELFCQ